ncbi:MAG: hypothetical protein Q8P30_03305 [Candidatus Uhrbacteria bacterium]|nr:hypothetical protein [Candidatus Uhrbacteria bacterium]
MSKNVIMTLAVVITLLAAWLLLEVAGVLDAGVLSEAITSNSTSTSISEVYEAEKTVEMSVDVVNGNLETSVDIAEE